jgi:sec-independent protein translocase protein TatC
VAPGLYEHERRLALPFVLVATIFFFGGASFCYGFVMPHGFRFLMDFNEQISQPTIMMQEHYALSVKLLLAFGVVFELPVAAMFLSAMGVITHRTLIAGWRYAVLGSFIFAAMLTPPDVITQVSMAVPLVVLYGVSIGVAWIFTSRRERAAEEGG